MNRILILVSILSLITISTLESQWKLTNGKWGSIRSIEINKNNIYAGSYATVYKLSNNELKWKLFNEKGDYNFFQLKDIKSCNDSVFLLSSDCLFLTTDDGNSWNKYPDSLFSNKALYNIVIKENQIYLCTNNGLYMFDKIDGSIRFIVGNFESSISTIFVSNDTIFVGGSHYYNQWKPRWPNIYISTNNGENWITIYDTLKSDIDKYTINCFDKNNNILVAGTDGGVYISTNNGFDWSVTSLYQKVVKCIKIINNKLYAGTNDGLFVSDDNGQTWSLRTKGLLYHQNLTYKYHTINTINSFEDKMYIGTEDDGVYISSDEGESWSSLNDGLGGGFVTNMVTDDSIFYACSYGFGLFKSTDEGEEWEKVIDKTITPNQILPSISNVVNYKNNIICGKYYKGLSYSNDFGNTWNNSADTPVVVKDSKIGCLEIYNSKIYAGFSGGVYLSTNWGESWVYGPSDLMGSRLLDIEFKDSIGIAATNYSATLVSLDSGNTWFKRNNGLPDSVVITCVSIYRNNLYAGTYHFNNSNNQIVYGSGIYMSTDFGKNWIDINDSITRNLRIISIAVLDSNIFICSADNHGILLSTNNGNDWRFVNDGLATLSLSKLLIHKDFIYAATGDGIYKAPLSDFGIVNVDEPQIETKNYLYCYPPYPNPSTNIVRSLIYWDTSLDIENDDIAVYDIFGNKVAGKEKITIDKQNAYSGLLSWDCSNVPDGIYLIRVVHGTKTWTLKVIVNK
ncbi:T9SS C-terminal target domain-containing protein [Bacteroidetes/Chlorobi group bacterium ChocPot_Mid]|nr:MAG: T9SS C-terminal target domain-containing protein [Bacteroidetes/Chlorobi group bacterium ChocPot_Mid]